MMNSGDGENSYLNNSLLQLFDNEFEILGDHGKREAIRQGRKTRLEAVKSMIKELGFPVGLRIADLGCSTGSNTLMVLSDIIDSVNQQYQASVHHKPPEVEAVLNDLPENDFNTTFKMVSDFYEKLQKEKGENGGMCFISGLPGSFYTRLFPTKSLHFVHSSYGLHWLSKVPEGLGNKNKGNVYMSRASPVDIHNAYLDQFQKDFSTFLSLRSDEMVRGGRMVLTFFGRNSPDLSCLDCCHFWEFLTKSLLDLVPEGMVKEAALDAFNMPYYDPYVGEIREIVRNQGSFRIDNLETFQYDLGFSRQDYNESDKNKTDGWNEAKCIRAVTEPILSLHFGSDVIDEVFKRFAMHVVEHVCCLDAKTTVNVVVSLTKM